MKIDEHNAARLWFEYIYIKSVAGFTYSEIQAFLDELEDLEKQLK